MVVPWFWSVPSQLNRGLKNILICLGNKGFSANKMDWHAMMSARFVNLDGEKAGFKRRILTNADGGSCSTASTTRGSRRLVPFKADALHFLPILIMHLKSGYNMQPRKPNQ